MSALLKEDAMPALRPARIEVISAMVIAGNCVHQHATVKLRIDGAEHTFQSNGEGNGPIDAICHALASRFGRFTCEYWSGKSASVGSDATAIIDITIRRDHDVFSGKGRHTDTIVATTLAIADALDKHRYHQWKIVS